MKSSFFHFNLRLYNMSLGISFLCLIFVNLGCHIRWHKFLNKSCLFVNWISCFQLRVIKWNMLYVMYAVSYWNLTVICSTVGNRTIFVIILFSRFLENNHFSLSVQLFFEFRYYRMEFGETVFIVLGLAWETGFDVNTYSFLWKHNMQIYIFYFTTYNSLYPICKKLKA